MSQVATTVTIISASWNQSALSPDDSFCTEMIQMVRGTEGETERTATDIYHEIVGECEHLEQQQECAKCQYRTETGKTEAIALHDLVDIVLEAAQTIVPRSADDNSDKSAVEILARKRLQNKSAAARYRDKQKQKSDDLRRELNTLEGINRELKELVANLERDIDKMRNDIFQNIKQIN